MDDLDQKIKAAKEKANPKRNNEIAEAKREANIAVEFIAGVVVPPFLGLLIDRHFDTSPAFVIAFLFLGLIGSTYNVYRDSQNSDGKIGLSGLQDAKKDDKQS